MKKGKIAFLGTPRQTGGHNFAYVLVKSTEKSQARQPEDAPKPAAGMKYKLVALHAKIQNTVKVGDEIELHVQGDIYESAVGANRENNTTRGNMSIMNTADRIDDILDISEVAMKARGLSDEQIAKRIARRESLVTTLVVAKKAESKAKSAEFRSRTGINFGVAPKADVPGATDN